MSPDEEDTVQDDIVSGGWSVILGPGTSGPTWLRGDGGYLVQDASTGELLHAIKVVAAGDAPLFPAVTRRLTEVFGAGPQPAAQPGGTAALASTPDHLGGVRPARLSHAGAAHCIAALLARNRARSSLTQAPATARRAGQGVRA
jgi:hypothetical protein